MRAVVDTNVPIVANGHHPNASRECQLKCIETLEALVNIGTILIDNNEFILNEYRKKLSLEGPPLTGNAFYRHVHDYQYQRNRVSRIDVTPSDHDGTDFKEFPKDKALANFDNDDRKFAAVALKGNAPVLNATDSDWENHEQALRKNGIKVKQLCPQEMTPNKIKK